VVKLFLLLLDATVDLLANLLRKSMTMQNVHGFTRGAGLGEVFTPPEKLTGPLPL
jgi:hypothetical protein